MVRRGFEIPEEDVEHLERLGLQWETIIEGNRWLLIDCYPIPEGYTVKAATLALLLPATYPEGQIDMAYFNPPLARCDGNPLGATQCMVGIDQRQFQRWSRHRTGKNPWQPGIDNLERHLYLVNHWLTREFGR